MGTEARRPGLLPYSFLVRLRHYGASVAVVLAATGLAFLMFGHFQPWDLTLVYMLATVFVAIRYGRGPSSLATILSVALFDFCFLPPYFSLAVRDDPYVLTFVVMLVVGITVGTLATRMRDQAEEAKQIELRARTEELRNALLSSVSHDLRTPLSTIIGAATTLLDEKGAALSPAQLDLLRAIHEEADRLSRLVTNLLAVTRVESRDLALRREWVPLEEVVGTALERLGPALRSHPVDLEIPPDLPLVPIDPVLIEQVFVNLLENAVRHTAADTPVSISAAAREHEVRIEVADRGPGLPPGEGSRVFEKFFRGPGAPAGGSGLGLAIARGVLLAHGGGIEAMNRPGGGALFRFTLPIVGRAPSVPIEGELPADAVKS
jgi:two-component system sensor histidine kinase KdpD